jgi:hypothetical protein
MIHVKLMLYTGNLEIPVISEVSEDELQKLKEYSNYTINRMCYECQEFSDPSCDLCRLADAYVSFDVIGETQEDELNEHIVKDILKRTPQHTNKVVYNYTTKKYENKKSEEKYL